MVWICYYRCCSSGYIGSVAVEVFVEWQCIQWVAFGNETSKFCPWAVFAGTYTSNPSIISSGGFEVGNFAGSIGSGTVVGAFGKCKFNVVYGVPYNFVVVAVYGIGKYVCSRCSSYICYCTVVRSLTSRSSHNHHVVDTAVAYG